MDYFCACGSPRTAQARECRPCSALTRSARMKGVARDEPTNLRHGHSWKGGSTPTYKSWSAMKYRCRSEGKYGIKGITVCERWQDFEAFLADMGERPEGTTLDRIDGKGNYEPGNVRWATHEMQMANRALRRGRCEPGCTCSRHTHRKCAEGCTCKKHTPPVRTVEWKARMSEGQRRYAARVREALKSVE